jgi:hypothetical protein
MKLSKPAKAQDLYVSPLFKLNLAYAKSLKPYAIYILSAKYGLVPLDKKLAPYDETLNTKRVSAIQAWAKKVLPQLRRTADVEHDEFIVLAGERYRRCIMPSLRHARVPMKGLGLGRQLQFLKHALEAHSV